ncbi:MAG: M14 family zinc carboxypeptidase [Gemmatimonadales bacterium]|jgi:hypothetical protein
MDRAVPVQVLVALVATCPAQAIAQDTCCSLAGGSIAEHFRIDAITERRFTHAELWGALDAYLDGDDLRVAEIGCSIHDLPIRAVSFGTGATTVLLWSQMHGDESTATMALADLIRFFAEGEDDPLHRRIAEQLTVVMVPMLNPDGAERFQRHSALGVDVNRDARRLATPEGRALRTLRDSLEPSFGFNLHDQSARTLAGEGGRQVAIALLAPAADSARSWTPGRMRARRLAALLAAAVSEEWPGRVAKYDDTFNPRAFGDLIQQCGTSTVLIESGALPDDPQKQELRSINVRLLLTALDAIAMNRLDAAPLAAYDSLPFNERITNDLLLVGGYVVVPDREPVRLDVALTYDDPVAHTGLSLGEIGDLEDVVAMDTLDVRGLYLHLSAPSALDPRDWWLIRGERVGVVVRRTASEESEVVLRLPRSP